MNPVKRPHEGGDQGQNPNKLQKTESGTPIDAAAMIAAKKAEIAAKLAAFKQKNVLPSSQPPRHQQQQQQLATPPSSIPSRPTPAPAPSSLPAGLAPDLAARIAAAKARVQASTMARNSGGPPPSFLPPSQQASSSTSSSAGPPPRVTSSLGIHPSLLEPTTSSALSTPGASSSRNLKPMQPKFSTLKANSRSSPASPAPNAAPEAPKVNPYLAASASALDAEGSEGPAPKGRSSRKFNFVEKGKYVAIAEQMRADANMEALRQRIAESARKAGLDSEFDALDRVVRRDAPPECEWWDEPLLPTKNYDDLTMIDSVDSPIKIYVQHPVQIAAPWDRKKVEIRPLMLTKKEAKKMRKQRRMADLKDRQDRVRMGLIPPDAPKVSLKNLMRVLASDAILDPTKVEAKVRRDVANRRLKHEKMNEANKLTDEQRREKVAKEKEKDEGKGLYSAVFKVRYLSNPSHKFKVRENAKQNSLTGCCLFNPKFCMILVEGSAKAVKFYKRVMLVRIDWTEEARARNADGEEEDNDDEGSNAGGGGGEEQQSLADNRCDLVWEGPIKERGFNIFRAKNVETEKIARDFLGEKNQGFWDVASKFTHEDV